MKNFFEYIQIHFPYYKELFQKHGLKKNSSIEKIMSCVPPLTRKEYRERIQPESLSFLANEFFIHDRSSGSYAEPVIRFSTWRDELAEETLTARAFEMAGMSFKDSVLSLEVGAPEIYTYYHRALSQLGVRDSYFINLTSHFRNEIDLIGRINPTTLISIPTVLNRALPQMLSVYKKLSSPQLKRIVYMGEMMPLSLRQTLCQKLGVEIFSFYGTTEVGGCAMECKEHRGHHLFWDSVIPTLQNVRVEKNQYQGEIFFTTLHFRSQCLLKYQVEDIVKLDFSPCPCGCPYPILEFIERKSESFPIFGIKFRHKTFAEALEKYIGTCFFQIQVEDKKDSVFVAFVFPSEFKKHRQEIEAQVCDVYEFDTLIKMNLVKTDFRFVSLSKISSRKTKKIWDKRVRTLEQSPI